MDVVPYECYNSFLNDTQQWEISSSQPNNYWNNIGWHYIQRYFTLFKKRHFFIFHYSTTSLTVTLELFYFLKNLIIIWFLSICIESTKNKNLFTNICINLYFVLDFFCINHKSKSYEPTPKNTKISYTNKYKYILLLLHHTRNTIKIL